MIRFSSMMFFMFYRLNRSSDDATGAEETGRGAKRQFSTLDSRFFNSASRLTTFSTLLVFLSRSELFGTFVRTLKLDSCALDRPHIADLV